MLLETEILNDVQSAAVRQTDGPVLIFAGAGSGKTRVLTHRIAYLLGEMRVAPDRILAVTFTNKAAGEMKSRLQNMVGAVARDLWVGTFHAMCVRILRRDGSRIGIAPTFAVIDDADQRQLIREILDDLDYDERQLTPGACLAEIDKAKNALVWPSEYAQKQTSFLGERLANVYTEYQRRLNESNSLDFDDLIVRTIDLLERDKTVREKYQRKFEYVLVDEYQDVNAAQYRLVALLAAHHGNITVVGDDDQSIYSWRGSDYRMILRFEEDFPGAAVFKLEENYRSTGRILDAANTLVANTVPGPRRSFLPRAATATRLRFIRRPPSATRLATSSKRSRASCARALPTATLSFSIAPTRSRAFSKRRCSPRGSPIASSAASVSTHAPRSRTSLRTCVTS